MKCQILSSGNFFFLYFGAFFFLGGGGDSAPRNLSCGDDPVPEHVFVVLTVVSMVNKLFCIHKCDPPCVLGCFRRNFIQVTLNTKSNYSGE